MKDYHVYEISSNPKSMESSQTCEEVFEVYEHNELSDNEGRDTIAHYYPSLKSHCKKPSISIPLGQDWTLTSSMKNMISTSSLIKEPVRENQNTK